MSHRFRRFILPAVLAASFSVALTACGSSRKAVNIPTTTASSTAPALSGSITVFAAASLTGAFTDLGKAFEAAHPGTKVTFSFGASSTLAQQIIQGAPADVFASASNTNMKQVTDANNAAKPKTFANNMAEIAVAPGKAATITSLSDLTKAGIKVALCEDAVPCG